MSSKQKFVLAVLSVLVAGAVLVTLGATGHSDEVALLIGMAMVVGFFIGFSRIILRGIK